MNAEARRLYAQLSTATSDSLREALTELANDEPDRAYEIGKLLVELNPSKTVAEPEPGSPILGRLYLTGLKPGCAQLDVIRYARTEFPALSIVECSMLVGHLVGGRRIDYYNLVDEVKSGPPGERPCPHTARSVSSLEPVKINLDRLGVISTIEELPDQKRTHTVSLASEFVAH